MDSSAEPDRLSNLPEVILVLIISCLPFKECVKTSTLSKRWRYLYRETKNVAFKESDFVSPSVCGFHRRIAFVKYVSRWVARMDDVPIDSFEISFSNPAAHHLDDIKSWIAFAVGKKVKNLVLDFSHPAWRNFDDVRRVHKHPELVFEVPESVYNLKTLESLKLYACNKFEPWRFSNPGILKTLSFGWMGLPNLESLLSVSTRLVSLSINACWGLDVMKIVGNMREFAIENCRFPVIPFTFNLPKVEIFRYSGVICILQFQRINAIIKEVYLDFGVWRDFDTTFLKSIVPNYILNGLPSVRTLTVCHYLLQMIETSGLHPVKTQHLVLKTKLHPTEFDGVRFLLSKCPDLETLTFDMLPLRAPTSVIPKWTASSYDGIDPQTYWMENITYSCMRNTLKVVVVRNFVGGLNELNVLKYLIRSGHEREIVLERVELHVLYGLDENQKMFAYAGAEMLQQSSKHVQVVMHN